MRNGFSLLEVLLALSITMVIAGAVFQIFHQNERVFRDQNLVTEMQQGARAAIAQVADEIRRAGQGVPLYAASFDTSPNEAVIAILSGSSATRINLRAGLAPAATSVTSPLAPLNLPIGGNVHLTTEDIDGFYTAIGGAPSGRFAYVWGEIGTSQWGWARASIASIDRASQSIDLAARETGSGGAEQFQTAPTIALEEAIAIYLDNAAGTLKHTTATNMTDPVNPTWAPANDLLTNITDFHIEYFDASGNTISADTLTNRSRIAQVNIRLVVQSTQDLSNHTRPSYAISARSNIRSASVHR